MIKMLTCFVLGIQGIYLKLERLLGIQNFDSISGTRFFSLYVIEHIIIMKLFL